MGQFARAIHACYPNAQLHSFEPLADIADQLEVNLSDAAKFRVFRTALGDVDGTGKFYRNDYSQSSSVLPTIGNEEGLLKGRQNATEFKLPISRLDTVLADVPLEPDVLLKLDLQGQEIAALRGAPQTLQRCSHLLIETVFEQDTSPNRCLKTYGPISASRDSASCGRSTSLRGVRAGSCRWTVCFRTRN